MMRVGTLCFATDQGLGILAKSFYDHGIVTDVLVIRHGRHPERDDWYPKAPRIGDLRDRSCIWVIEEFCKSMDAILFFETPFIWSLLNYCHVERVATALMPMYECMPSTLPAQPDLFINPSYLDQQYYPSGIHIPVPVEQPWRLRERAEVFVHNAGHGGLKGRNGTQELLQAIDLVTTPAHFIIRAQGRENLGRKWRTKGGGDVVMEGTVPYNLLYQSGDVFIFPEKFNGLSLPLQEARAAGMLVMCGDRFPMNRWLPTSVDGGMIAGDPLSMFPVMRNPLIPVESYRSQRVAGHCNEFQEAVFDPRQIAAKIDEFYGRDISEYSRQGREWALMNSWEVLGPQYKQALEEIVR